MRGPASATLPVEMPRRLSFFRTQNVTSVRPPHPMVNGDDSAHDHNALNAHNVNDLTMTMMRVVIMICLHMNVTPMIIGGGGVQVLQLSKIIIFIIVVDVSVMLCRVTLIILLHLRHLLHRMLIVSILSRLMSILELISGTLALAVTCVLMIDQPPPLSLATEIGVETTIMMTSRLRYMTVILTLMTV